MWQQIGSKERIFINMSLRSRVKFVSHDEFDKNIYKGNTYSNFLLFDFLLFFCYSILMNFIYISSNTIVIIIV